MNHRITSAQLLPLALVALMVLTGLSAYLLDNGPEIDLSLNLPVNVTGVTEAEAFDYERAAEITGIRWQAMARFYEEQGLLTRDNFDYEQAAENVAYRWQAMARFYKDQDLLTRDDFNYELSADQMAYRWLAMARYYESLGLLNER